MHEMPDTLRRKAEEQAAGMDRNRIRKAVGNVSESYRRDIGKGKRLVTEKADVVAYAVTRMPATYGAVHFAVTEMLKNTDLLPATMVDCGAGTGAAALACADVLPLQQIRCLEREAVMRQVGENLTAGLPAVWESVDLTGVRELPGADLVCASYLLGEMKPEEQRMLAIRMWKACRLLLLIEPGTVQGFQNLKAVRSVLEEQGAKVLAPCPAQATCRENWCHFAVRVPRTRLHRQMKGEVPYEDEKFAYLAFGPAWGHTEARIVRHPVTESGRITLSLCTQAGTEERVVTKKDPLWKRVRKVSWGESLDIE